MPFLRKVSGIRSIIIERHKTARKTVIEVLSKLERSFHFLVVAGLLGSSDVSQHKVLGDSKLEAILFSYRCSFEKKYCTSV